MTITSPGVDKIPPNTLLCGFYVSNRDTSALFFAFNRIAREGSSDRAQQLHHLVPVCTSYVSCIIQGHISLIFALCIIV